MSYHERIKIRRGDRVTFNHVVTDKSFTNYIGVVTAVGNDLMTVLLYGGGYKTFDLVNVGDYQVIA